MARTWSHMSSAALGPGTFGTPSKPEIPETVRHNQKPIKTRNSKTLKTAARNLLEPIEWNHLRFPEPGSFSDPPQLAQNTPKSILCKDPIAFCCWGKNVKKCLSRRMLYLQWDAVAVKLEEESCFKTRLSCSATCGSCLGDLRNRRMRTEWGIVLQCPPMNAFDFESSLNQWSFRKTGPWRW